jgi:3-deoxy-D-manno-octulosonic-acid transferase
MKFIFWIYQLLWFVAIPLALRSPRLQEGKEERTLQKIRFQKTDIWIHAASVGEAFIARQIIQNFPETEHFSILITTNTRQGKDILEKELSNLQHQITVAYMVFDQPSLVKKAVAIANPRLLVLIELEIWPALMAEMKRRHIPILIANGRMTQKSFSGYKKVAPLWRRLKPETILAISDEDKLRFQQLFQQSQTFHISNIKFDRIQECQIKKRDNHSKQSLILASIRKEEEEQVLYLIETLLQEFPNLTIDLFPRHLHRVPAWEQLLQHNKINYSVKSKKSQTDNCSVIIWDVFGELMNGYQRADAAFVGGSLADLGGQNFIEAFMNGVIPVTGPSIFNFLWTGEMVFTEGLVKKGRDKKEVAELLKNLLHNPPDRKILQEKANNYIRLQQGGSRKTCQHIVDLMNS